MTNNNSEDSDSSGGGKSDQESSFDSQKSGKETNSNSVCLRQVNLFILVFLAGVFTASLTALILFPGSIPLANVRLKKSSEDPAHLLPDPDHLKVVDESRYFTTQLQRFMLKNELNKDADDTEALKSLGAALTFKSKGQNEKALKLFKHAIDLSPKHPQVLIHYGEFLMDINQDPIGADHQFVKAMAFSDLGSDENSRALLNRQKTAVLVEELDSKMLKSIDEKKKSFLRINQKSSALRRAKKEAYFQHIYHTVGIEGNTLNLAQTRTLLETKLAIGGKSVQEHNEVLGLDSALKYINQTLVDRPQGDITLRDILEIHKRVIGHVDPIEAGFFR